MEVHFGLPATRLGPTALTIGSFDGIHLGHQAVLARLREEAHERGLLESWITFDPHPRCVLDPANCPPQVTTLEERLEAVAALAVDHAVVVNFTRELAALEAEQFMALVLGSLDLKVLVAGPDFALGKGRRGDLEWLRAHGREHGYEVVVAEPFLHEGQEVHSSDVRRLLILGEVGEANRLLGHGFSLSGIVQPGDQVGRKLGYPTVNLAIEPGKLIPGQGIYAGWALTPAGSFEAAVSIGYRPTFGDTHLKVEAYLLDFQGDLYGKRLEIRFVSRLRDGQIRFDTPEELALQIARDVDDTRAALAEAPRP